MLPGSVRRLYTIFLWVETQELQVRSIKSPFCNFQSNSGLLAVSVVHSVVEVVRCINVTEFDNGIVRKVGAMESVGHAVNLVTLTKTEEITCSNLGRKTRKKRLKKRSCCRKIITQHSEQMMNATGMAI